MEIVLDVALSSLTDVSGFTALKKWFEQRGLRVVKAIDVEKPRYGINEGRRPIITQTTLGYRANFKPTHQINVQVICHPRRLTHKAIFLVEAKKIGTKKPAKKTVKKRSKALPRRKVPMDKRRVTTISPPKFTGPVGKAMRRPPRKRSKR